MKDEYDFSKARRGRFYRQNPVDVVQVEPRGGYRLAIKFSDGAKGERDFADVIAEGGEMVEPLRDPAFFARVFLDDGILTWPNGFDLDSIALHMDMQQRSQLRRTVAEAH